MKLKFMFFALTTGVVMQSFTFKKQAINWKLDQSHSSVAFAVDHLVISETKGEFTDYTLHVHADKPDFTDADFEMKINVNSINTRDAERDKHLKSDAFFDAEKFPQIIFKGKRMARVKGSQYRVLGDLTMHGVTKSVILSAKFGGIVKDPWGGVRTGVTVWGELDRYDFGLKYNSVLENGGLAIGQKVRIQCSIELIKGE